MPKLQSRDGGVLSCSLLLVHGDVDSPDDTLSAIQRAALVDVEADVVASVRGALELMRARRYDVILLDVRGGETGARQALMRVSSQCCETPVVLLQSEVDEESYSLAIRSGAHDCFGCADLGTSVAARALHHAVASQSAQKVMRGIQRGENLARLSAGVSHEFSNILSVVLGHAQLGLARGTGDERARRRLRSISRAVAEASGAASRALAYAGGAPVSRRRVALSPLVQRVVATFDRPADGSGSTTFRAMEAAAWVLVDAGQLEGALMNLLTNAREAADSLPATILVTTEPVVIAEGERTEWTSPVAPPPPGSYFGVRVEDDGPGVPAPLAHRIFQPFFTQKEAGRGLGLSSALGVAELNHGWLQVCPTEDRGRFRLLLPTAPTP